MAPNPGFIHLRDGSLPEGLFHELPANANFDVSFVVQANCLLEIAYLPAEGGSPPLDIQYQSWILLAEGEPVPDVMGTFSIPAEGYRTIKQYFKSYTIRVVGKVGSNGSVSKSFSSVGYGKRYRGNGRKKRYY